MASVTKRGNSYLIRVFMGRDQSGKQLFRNMTWVPEPGLTPKQQEKALSVQVALFEERCKAGKLTDSKLRFAVFADIWLADYAKPQLRATTINRYQRMLPRIKESIGHFRLCDLQPRHLLQLYNQLAAEGSRKDKRYQATQEFFNEILRQVSVRRRFAKEAGISADTLLRATRGEPISKVCAEKIACALNLPFSILFTPAMGSKPALSKRTILHHHRLISSILSAAVQWQMISVNVCKLVKPPRAERREARFLNQKEALQLLALLEAEQVRYRAAVVLLLFTGLRRSEALGLHWEDVDVNNHTILVNKSSLYLKGKGIFEDDTKSECSHRQIKVSPVVIQALLQLKDWQEQQKSSLGDDWLNSGKVFTSLTGSPLHPDSLAVWFRRFIMRSGLPPISLHSLRHTHATLLIASGTNIKTVSSRLGHSQTSVTLNIYTHAIKSVEEDAVKHLDALLAKQTTE